MARDVSSIAVVGLVLAAICSTSEADAKDQNEKLLRIIERDESFKVRMQAIRVLAKRLEKTKTPPSDRLMSVLSSAATTDEEHLVRGMACFALGKIGDPRGKKALETALRDGESFVRAQAEEALRTLRQGTAPAADGKKTLVIGTDLVPGVSPPPEISGALRGLMERGFSARAGQAFVIGDTNGRGYHMKGSIAELSVQPDGEASRVTIVVKIAIATWPDNNLRHVMSARASVRAKVTNGSSLVRLQRKLLEAAVNKAVQDSMAQIGGS